MNKRGDRMSDTESENELFLTQSKFKTDEKDLKDFAFRFGEPMTAETVKKKLKSSVSKRTEVKNTWAIGIFKRWQQERKQRSVNENLRLPPSCLSRGLQDMEKSDLNTALTYFLFEARKQNGEVYPSTTLYGIYAAFASIVREHSAFCNLFEDDEFNEARKALDAAMKERSGQGFGASTSKSTEIISEEEEQQLWEKGILGDSTPRTLLDTILYLTGLNFALRGGDEHRKLRMFKQPQITGPFLDNKGRRFLRYVEDVSKTNNGGIKQRKTKLKDVRAYENNERPDRCFIRLYEKYKSLCPKTLSEGRDAFYLTPLRNPTDFQWYRDMPVGHNTLGDVVKKMCNRAGIGGKKTNHSLRATAATRLYQAKVDEQTICDHTGHRSEAVRVYKRASDDQKAAVSEILAKATRTESASSTVVSASNIAVNELNTAPKPGISLTLNFH